MDIRQISLHAFQSFQKKNVPVFHLYPVVPQRDGAGRVRFAVNGDGTSGKDGFVRRPVEKHGPVVRLAVDDELKFLPLGFRFPQTPRGGNVKMLFPGAEQKLPQFNHQPDDRIPCRSSQHGCREGVRPGHDMAVRQEERVKGAGPRSGQGADKCLRAEDNQMFRVNEHDDNGHGSPQAEQDGCSCGSVRVFPANGREEQGREQLHKAISEADARSAAGGFTPESQPAQNRNIQEPGNGFSAFRAEGTRRIVDGDAPRHAVDNHVQEGAYAGPHQAENHGNHPCGKGVRHGWAGNRFGWASG